jgi:hypothetical protein
MSQIVLFVFYLEQFPLIEKTFILETKLVTTNIEVWRNKRKLELNRVALLKKALLIVALSFLLYTLYQAITTTIFVIHFPLVVTQLSKFIESTQPTLQLALFLFQEIAGSIGSYLRLIGAIFALNCAFLFFKNNAKYLQKLRLTLLFESLYFLLLFPAAINHLVGSVISSSAFLNFYTGVSCLLQAVLIFPVLFMLSRKLRNTQNIPSILKWACVAASLYVFGFWVRHGLLWVYAIWPLETQPWSLFGTVGFVNSLLTLLVAAVVCVGVCLTFWQKKKLNLWLAGTAITLVGVYFAIYDLVSVWDPIYRAYLPLTDFWMITLLFLGVVVLVDSRSRVNV